MPLILLKSGQGCNEIFLLYFFLKAVDIEYSMDFLYIYVYIERFATDCRLSLYFRHFIWFCEGLLEQCKQIQVLMFRIPDDRL